MENYLPLPLCQELFHILGSKRFVNIAFILASFILMNNDPLSIGICNQELPCSLYGDNQEGDNREGDNQEGDNQEGTLGFLIA